MTLPPPRILGEPACAWDVQAELGEGTCWSVREQALYFVDILGRRLLRYAPADGSRREWTLPDTVSAVAERRGGGLLVTLRRGFAFFDPASGELQTLDEPEPDRPANRFNDGKCDERGRFWGGTIDFDCKAPTGALYRFEGPGRCERAFDARFAVTNGPAWSRDGRTMYFNETAARRVHAFDFDPATGALSRPREWLRLPEADGFPDGMTTDAAGRLWICHWAAACVTCHDPGSGAELARLRLPTSNITNVAFGGPRLRTLFITSARTELTAAQREAQPLAGALFSVDLEDEGLPAHLFAG